MINEFLTQIGNQQQMQDSGSYKAIKGYVDSLRKQNCSADEMMTSTKGKIYS